LDPLIKSQPLQQQRPNSEPDHQIADLGFVFQGDEDDAMRGARHLPHEHEPSDRDAPVPGRHFQRPRRVESRAARLTFRLRAGDLLSDGLDSKGGAARGLPPFWRARRRY
jgi:hypothetical protein